MIELRRRQIDYLERFWSDLDAREKELVELGLDHVASMLEYFNQWTVLSALKTADTHLKALQEPNTIDALPSGDPA